MKRMKNQGKEQKSGFTIMLSGTLSASLLGNIWAGEEVTRAAEGTTRIDKFLMPPHPLICCQIEKCYQNEPKFNGV